MKHKIINLSFLVVGLLCIIGCGKIQKDTDKSETVTDAAIEISETESTGNTESSCEVVCQKQGTINPYDAIISEIAAFVKGDTSYEIYPDGMTGLAEVVMPEDSNAAETVGYAYYDIDGNGIDELIITANDEDPQRILAVYTIQNDEVVLVVEGFYRNRFYLLDDNSIYNEGSGGAAYSIFANYIMEKDGNSLTVKDYYFTDFSNPDDENTWGWFHNTTGEYDVSVSESLDEDVATQKSVDYISNVKHLEINHF